MIGVRLNFYAYTAALSDFGWHVTGGSDKNELFTGLKQHLP